MTRRILPVLVAALAAPNFARAAGVTLEGFYGLTRPPSADFSQAVSGAGNDPNLIHDSLNIAGGDVILHLGLLELGAVIDTSWKSNSASQTAIAGLAGVGGDMGGWLRLEALGEIGAQRYGNFTENPNIVTSGSDQWLMYLGLRPGVAVRTPIGQGKTGLLFGVWGYARWDLTTSTVDVTVGNAGSVSPGSVKLGGTTIGAELRLGLDF